MSDETPRMDGHIRRKKPKQSKRERRMVIATLLVLVGTAGLVILADRGADAPPPPESDRAADLADIEVFREVTPVGDEGWVATLPLTWSGDSKAEHAACQKALVRLGARSNQTLTIVGPEGVPVAECGAE